MIKDLVKKNRSYRRFFENVEVSADVLTDLVDTAHFTASAANKQPLRYMIVSSNEDKEKVFSTLRWAGALKDWDGPSIGERPGGYIIILGRENVNSAQDEGIVAQTILLAATEQGLGGCIFGNIDRQSLMSSLNIPSDYVVKLVIAIGKPKEEVVLDEISNQESTTYYRDDNQVHHVPKIKLKDLIIK